MSEANTVRIPSAPMIHTPGVARYIENAFHTDESVAFDLAIGMCWNARGGRRRCHPQ